MKRQSMASTKRSTARSTAVTLLLLAGFLGEKWLKNSDIYGYPSVKAEKGKGRASDPALPERMDVDASGDDDDERSYIVKTDHNITFTGEAEQLAALWLHIKLKKLLDSDVRKQRACCAYTASLFRGKALDWFARTLPTNKLLLSDFKTLKALVKEVFGKSKDVTTARAQIKSTQTNENVAEKDRSTRPGRKRYEQFLRNN